MKRFVLITAVGAAALLGGPGFLAVNLFPGHLGSFGMLAQGCVALALGTAVFASGMLGLAESYEKTVSRLSHFLDDREHAAELAVRDEGDVATQNAAFWNGYQKTAAGTILFLAGILSLMIGLIDMSLSAYMAGVMTGIAVFGITAILLMFKGLRSIRRSHVAVASAAAVMALQPETKAAQFPSEPPIRSRTAPKRSVFSNRPKPGNLEPRRYPQRRPY